MNIAVAGSHGLIGNNLVTFFRKSNNNVSRIVRSKEQNGIFWDPHTGYINHEKLENYDAIINLCGEKIASLKIELYGSLALTGKGHGTDRGVLMGLEGNEPSSIDTEQIPVRLDLINRNKTLNLMNEHCIPFEEKNSLIFYHDEFLPHHSNGMRFKVFDADQNILLEQDFYSVGGGFILNNDEIKNEVEIKNAQTPFPFNTWEELFIHSLS